MANKKPIVLTSGSLEEMQSADALASSLIAGTTTNDSAAAGKIGEYAEGTLALGSATSMTSATPKTIASISLTAGDWDISCNLGVYGLTSLTITNKIASISTVNNTLDSALGRIANSFATESIGTGTTQQTCGPVRFSLASTTTVYLVGRVTISSGTAGGYGIISARRVR